MRVTLGGLRPPGPGYWYFGTGTGVLVPPAFRTGTFFETVLVRANVLKTLELLVGMRSLIVGPAARVLGLWD